MMVTKIVSFRHKRNKKDQSKIFFVKKMHNYIINTSKINLSAKTKYLYWLMSTFLFFSSCLTLHSELEEDRVSISLAHILATVLHTAAGDNQPPVGPLRNQPGILVVLHLLAIFKPAHLPARAGQLTLKVDLLRGVVLHHHIVSRFHDHHWGF